METWEAIISRRVVGLPDDRHPAYLLPFRYPAGRPLQPIQRPDRRAFEDVAHRGGW
jgi:hypothetical protein